MSADSLLRDDPGQSRVPDSEGVDAPSERFRALAEEWRSRTWMLSMTPQITGDPAYQTIIGEGRAEPDVWLRLILRELTERPGMWYPALKEVAGVSPVKPEQRGRLDQVREAWLQWGRENRLIGQADLSGSDTIGTSPGRTGRASGR